MESVLRVGRRTPRSLTRAGLALAGLALGLPLLAASTASAQRPRAGDEPRPTIYRSGVYGWQVDLPPAMEDALDRFDRDFEPWTERDYPRGAEAYEFSPRQTPWAVVGDFNGDGRPDLAIAGRNDRDASVVFVLSTGRSRYRALEAEREPFDPEDPSSIRLPVLSYLYPGRYVIADPRLLYPREIVIAQPAVQIVGGRRQGAIVYAVEENALVPYYLSDRPAPPSVRPRTPPSGTSAPGRRTPARAREPVPVRTGDSATPSR